MRRGPVAMTKESIMSTPTPEVNGAGINAITLEKSTGGNHGTASYEAVQALTTKPLDDIWIYRIVVVLLGVVMLTAMVGSLMLMANGGEEVPDIFLALGSAAVGALAGLIAPSPKH
jgi:hypothetical protein